jgi:hypothetical protein
MGVVALGLKAITCLDFTMGEEKWAPPRATELLTLKATPYAPPIGLKISEVIIIDVIYPPFQ